MEENYVGTNNRVFPWEKGITMTVESGQQLLIIHKLAVKTMYN